MRIVTCYECGKRYDYDDDGFCPNCGAFNPPPSTSRIGPDGAVVWIDGLNEQNHQNSFTHREYHAEERERRRLKLDHVPQKPKQAAPKSANTWVSLSEPLGNQLRGGAPAKKNSGKKKVPGLLWLLLAVILGFNVLLPMLVSLITGW